MTYQLVLYFVIALVLLLMLDGVWFGLIAGRYYRKHLGYIYSDYFNYWLFAVLYLIYAASLVAFVVEPSITDRPIRALGCAVAYGAGFGFTAYAAYNLTNLATVRHWSMRVSLIDLAWGTITAAIVSGTTVWIARTFIV
jgi:uncharacterized membrane protein